LKSSTSINWKTRVERVLGRMGGKLRLAHQPSDEALVLASSYGNQRAAALGLAFLISWDAPYLKYSLCHALIATHKTNHMA